MEVIRAEVSGFCSGVKRALRMAEECVDGSRGAEVYSLGDLVHNDMVMKRLRERGIKTAGTVDEIDSGVAVIRAHGATPETLEALKEHGINIVDATCPKVKRSHRIIEQHSVEGYRVIVAGEREHSEVRGLVARAARVTVLETAEEAACIECESHMMVIAQTTFSSSEYARICDTLQSRCSDVEVFHTICPAMERRHEALVGLSKKVDAIIVVGGKQSANTKRLYEKAESIGKPSWHIEHADELPEHIFRYRRVGIAAGASTPDWVVDEVERRLQGEGRGI